MSVRWQRAGEPTPIPNPVEVDTFDDWDEEAFGWLLLDNLVPHGPNKTPWRRLWETLSAEETLARRSEAALDAWIAILEEDRTGGTLGDEERRAAGWLLSRCRSSKDRLRFDPDQPLGWVGRSALRVSKRARPVIESLVTAIDEHRASVAASGQVHLADQHLWAALADVGLDPDIPGRLRPPTRQVSWKMSWAGDRRFTLEQLDRALIQALRTAILEHHQAARGVPARPADVALWRAAEPGVLVERLGGGR